MDKVAQEITGLINYYRAKHAFKVKIGRKTYDVMKSFDSDFGYVIGSMDTVAMNFAKQHSIPQILGHYKIPLGLKRGNLQTYLILLNDIKQRGHIKPDDYDARILVLWKNLIKLNPELKDIPVAPYHSAQKKQAIRERWFGIMGVDDNFNVNDINYFIRYIMLPQHHFPARQSRVSWHVWETNKYEANVERMTSNMQWRPSLPTLKAIFHTLNNRPEPSPSPKTKVREAGPKLIDF